MSSQKKFKIDQEVNQSLSPLNTDKKLVYDLIHKINQQLTQTPTLNKKAALILEMWLNKQKK